MLSISGLVQAGKPLHQPKCRGQHLLANYDENSNPKISTWDKGSTHLVLSLLQVPTCPKGETKTMANFGFIFSSAQLLS